MPFHNIKNRMFDKKTSTTVSVHEEEALESGNSSINNSGVQQLSYDGTDYKPGEALEVDEDDINNVHRGMKSRHILLIGIGGCIGTGLFVGTGANLAKTGPAPLLMSYLLMSFAIWSVMNNLSEMATYLPLKGVSISGFVSRYADDSLGFACGYNLFYTFAIMVATEVTAVGLIIEYWNDEIHIAIFMTVFLAAIVILNFLPNKYFGEMEFWFALIKVLCILGLIVVGIVIFFGGAPSHDRIGFRYWKNPGAFAERITPGAGGRFLDVWTALILSGFSFILGPELIITAAAEAKRPRYNIPKVANSFIWRIMFFYIAGSLVVGCTVPYNHPRLLSGGSNASASPYVIAIQSAGIKVLPDIINACILTSAWSAGNAYMFSGSRMLLQLAKVGQAPQIFNRVNKYGVPWTCMILVSAISCLAYLNVSAGSAKVFTWLSNLCTISGFISWLCSSVAFLRWRKAMILQGRWDSRPYKTALQPYATYYALFLLGMVVLTNGYDVFIKGRWDTATFIAAYVTIPPFVILWLGHKFFFNKHKRLLRPLSEIDLVTGLQAVEAEAEKDFFEIEQERATSTAFNNPFLRAFHYILY
ncbi:BA75_05132T0 [Komagataella pastoris]|uniref:BA75_05132T0 n=1 Tax=Komagataella pastoris TaxID=4922 RepID=A0A1B2JHV2_PICPA|nr:BA75_05132T0 [Komagataella pastoris]